MTARKAEKKGHFIDAHIHAEPYAPEEWPHVLRRAQEAGLVRIVVSGMDLNTSLLALTIASSSSILLASVGLHPWLAARGLPENLVNRLESFTEDSNVVAIGEVGLDLVDNCAGTTFFDQPALFDLQVEAFRLQIRLAISHHLPLIIHARGAYPQVISVLREERAERARGLVHNFDGSPQEAEALWELGFYVSFGGAITYPEALQLHDTVRSIPLRQILLETDSPYMPLYKQASKNNEPANVIRIAHKLAELKGVSLEEVAEATYCNFLELFPKK